MLRPADMSSISAVATAQRPHILWVVGVVPDKMGGFERTCVEFAKQASQRGVRASFVFEGEPCCALSDALAACGASYHVISDVGVLGIRHSLRLARHLSRLKPDFVHLHFCEFYRSFNPMAALLGTPLAATYHYSGEPVASHGWRRLLKRLRRRVFAGSLRRVSAVSAAAREKLVVDYIENPERVAITYNGTDLLGISNRVPSFANDLKLPEAVANASPKLLYVGALSQSKGVHVAIRALQKLSAGSSWATLTVVGAGPDRAELERLAAELNVAARVFFLGLRSDVPQLLASHDIMLVPSIWKEAFGYVVVEAMAVGCPVIASNIGGIPEVITDGKEGILVPAGDSDALAAQIERLAKNPSLRSALIAGAADKVRRVFSLDQSVARFWKLYS